jgi:hypothetical protein
MQMEMQMRMLQRMQMEPSLLTRRGQHRGDW